MQNLQKKISSAKTKLLLHYPLFGIIASRLELVVNDDIQAFRSNGIMLEYNSDFLEKIDSNEMEFIFANGAMHATLAHERRKNGRSSWLWQLSTDYAINDMLVENGLDRPKEAHYNPKFRGLYAEEIYEELKTDILRDELEYEAQDQDETKQDTLKKENFDENQELQERLFEDFAKSVFDSELKKDEIPVSAQRFFTLKSSQKRDWRDELKVALERFCKDDYTLLPPNKKFLHSGIYLPSCISQKLKFALAIDSSGSIDERMLGLFLGELGTIMLSVQNYEMEFFICDDKIRFHKTFYGGDILDISLFAKELQSGGFTDFRAVFEFLEHEREGMKLLLYFSDLDGIFPDHAPNFPTKWVTPKEREVPFGEIVVID